MGVRRPLAGAPSKAIRKAIRTAMMAAQLMKEQAIRGTATGCTVARDRIVLALMAAVLAVWRGGPAHLRASGRGAVGSRGL